jgi:TPR repeat protein
LKWFQRAAEHGHAKAQLVMGLAYLEGGFGLPRDPSRAVQYLTRSATQGDVDAQYNLGLLLAKGQGTRVDLVEAFKWLELARRQGYATAIDALSAVKPALSSSQLFEALKRADTWKPE